MKSTMAISAKDDKRYRAEADLRTLIEAEKIKGDKARMKAALAVKKEMMAQMEEIDEEVDEDKSEKD